MLPGKRFRKIIAVKLLIVMLINTFTPTITYALTSGPTQPEATSFEPVDTTDMVNLQTGDFTYNLPLLEVPGPEGGYPLSLSYHAGIQPNEEASWVGLGWTLNPGAITRSVNGYPDDWYAPTGSNRVYWQGGTTTTYKVGVSVGIANTPVTVSYGLSFSQDTYRGFSTGTSFGLGLRYKIGGKNSPVSANIGFEHSTEGGYKMSGGIGISTPGDGLNASASIGFTTNFETFDVNASTGVSYRVSNGDASNPKSMGFSLLGASISSGSSEPSWQVGGLTSSISSGKEGKVQTNSSSWKVDIPIYYFNLSLGYNKTRYWTDEKADVTTHGSLYSSGWEVTDKQAFDTYALLEDPSVKNFIDYPDPKTVQGGAYLDFDAYNVSAQGLGGTIRPYQFKGEILGQNARNSSNEYLVQYLSPGVTDGRPNFRFDGDFSNSYRQNYPGYANPDLNLRLVEPPFDANPVYGNNDGNYGTGYNEGFQLAGSRHIDVGVKIKPGNAAGYVKEEFYKSRMIDGFSITNESGVTYHYSLPAYAWGEEMYQEKIDRTTGLAFNRAVKPQAYAYTWYLTAITGPDYVDRNNNQLVDGFDWGYWVSFEYGKWSNNFVWRNPAEGFHRDEDNKWQNCSMGKKEVYYLNAIRTRSHTAYFEKDIRTDAKGASPSIFTKNTNSTDYVNTGMYDVNSSQSLRLNAIYLFNNDSYFSLSPSTGDSVAFEPNGYATRTNPCTGCEMAYNILDKTDIEAAGRANVEYTAVRIIDFIHDYSLCNRTRNSIDINTPTGETTGVNKYGKLTLNAVNFRGKRGFSYSPPVKFEYDLDAEDMKTATGTLTATSFSTTTPVFQPGDLLTLVNASAIYNTYCGVITGVTTSGGTTTYQLANNSYGSGTVTLRTTKNPAYNKNAYDIWGLYKSDINTTVLADDENTGRMVSPLSAKSTDAWCLRKIYSPMGAEIKLQYESDDYTPVLTDEYSLSATAIQRVTGNNSQLRLTTANIGLTGYYQVGQQVDLLLLLHSIDPNSIIIGCGAWKSLKYSNAEYNTKSSVNATIIKEVGADYVIVENADFAGFYETPITVYDILGSTVSTTCLSNKVPQACNLKVVNRNSIPGGGIRVKKVVLSKLNDNSSYTVAYGYNIPGNTTQSSGVTTYEPWVLSNTNIFTPSDDLEGPKIFKRAVYKSINAILAMAREIPPPGVMYEHVSVTNEIKNADEASARREEGLTQYQFEVFRENMVGRQLVGSQQGSWSGSNHYVKNIAIKKFTGCIGNVKRITQLGKDGKKLSEVINHYLHDGLENLSFSDFMTQYKTRLETYAYQGYLQERLAEVKEVTRQTDGADNGVKATLSGREHYPCINTGQTTINYVNGTRESSQVLGFDFYSGAITKTVETDAYGNRFMTEVIPAYRKYSSLGLKLSNGNNKNMLTQTAGSYVYKVDANNTKLGLVAADAQTWSNGIKAIVTYGGGFVIQNNSSNGNVWRKQASYLWMPDNKTGDGITAMGSFTEFNFTTPDSSNSNWKKSDEITLYDVYSKALEAKDANGNFATSHTTFDQCRIEITGTPATFYEIAYSGTEEEDDYLSSLGFSLDEGWITNAVSHTGARSLGTAGNQGVFVFDVSTDKLVAGRDYLFCQWVKPVSGTVTDIKLSYEINGVQKAIVSSASSTVKANGWTQVTLMIKGSDIVPGKSLTVRCRNDHNLVAYMDDMLFRPANAKTTAYVYDPHSCELTHIIDHNNLYTKFEYDAGGRLVRIYKEKPGVGPVKKEEYTYNYSPQKYFNTAIHENIMKNNCYSQTGSLVMIDVPAGAFTSYLNGYADKEARIYAQNEANRLGSCVVPTMIYVRKELGPVFYRYNGCIATEHNAVKLKFYADVAGTVPLVVSGLTVKIWHGLSVNGTDSSSTYNLVCNGKEVVVDPDMISYYTDYCGGTSYTNELYSILSLTGYQVIN
jgi:hypothetical protein